MNRSARARQLAEQHRQAQVQIRAGFLASFLPTWSLLDWRRLDDTTPAWIQVVMALVRPWRQASANAAVQHYAEYRLLTAPRPLEPAPAVEFVDGPDVLPEPPWSSTTGRGNLLTFDPGRAGLEDRAGRGILLDGVPGSSREGDTARIDWAESDRAARHSLLVTGPGELKRQASMGRTEQQAKDRGLVVVSGSISRQVLNGGRTATLTSVAADQQAIGWARLTDGDPCAFCIVLASRGPAYKSEASAGFQAHDNCACIPVAVFSKTAAWPGQAREFRRLYDRVAAGQKDPINTLRRYLAAQEREAATKPQPQTA